MIQMVILDQIKPISQYLKIKKSKIQKSEICKVYVWGGIIHKNGNKTSIQPILKSNSTYFMFNNILCEMKGKKVIHWEGREGPVGMGNRSNFVLEV